MLRIHLRRLHYQEAVEILLGEHQITAEPYLTDSKFLALCDVRSDVDLLLVGGYRHLSGVNIELQITAIEIIGRQCLKIRGELFFGVLVVTREKGEPTPGLQFKKVEEVLIGENIITHNVDMLNGRYRAFIDVDGDRHAIPGLCNDLRIDGRIIATLQHILPLQLELHAF